MAKGSRQIAEEHFPGWKATRVTSMEEGAEPLSANLADGDRRSSDATMPGLDELRRKYLGARDSGGQDSPPVADSSDDTELVELESGSLKKVAAVSKKRRKVIWSQG